MLPTYLCCHSMPLWLSLFLKKKKHKPQLKGTMNSNWRSQTERLKKLTLIGHARQEFAINPNMLSECKHWMELKVEWVLRFISCKSIKLTKFNQFFCRTNVFDGGEIEIPVLINNCKLSVAGWTTLAKGNLHHLKLEPDKI